MREIPPSSPVIRQGFEAVCSRHDYVTVEGSGGILCPLRVENGETLWLEDVIRSLQLPSVIVAGRGPWYHQQRGADGEVYARQKAPCKGHPL